MPLYALVGVFATVVHYVVLVTLVERAGMDATAATAAGATAGALAAYAGNRRYTFASRAAHIRALPRFLVVAALGAATNAAIVFTGTAWLGLHYFVPQAAATLVVFFAGFALNRRWSFT